MSSSAEHVPKWPRDGYDEEWLALEDAAGGRFILDGDIAKASVDFNNTMAAIAKTWPPLEEQLEIRDDNTGPNHGNMPVRIYRPKSEEELPLMVHFPGGGFFAGNLDTEDYQARHFAAKIPCVVVSVLYPKQPDAQLDAIIAHGVMAVEWCRSQSATLKITSKTLLCGGSAGSWLSEQVAYHFTSTGQHDVIHGCVLLYVGVVHWTYNGPYKHLHKSWDELGHAQVPLFGLDESVAMWSNLGIRPSDPKHCVFMAEDLSKYPPCYLMSAGKDVFRDSGVMMQMRLKEAGVRCKYDYYPGLPHWFHVFPQLRASHEMLRNTVEGAKFLLAG